MRRLGIGWVAVALGCTGAQDGPDLAEFGLDARPPNPTCLAPEQRFVEPTALVGTPVWTSVALNNPVALLQAPGDPHHWYAVEQGGKIKRFDGREAEPTAQVVLDLGGQITAGGEAGLLGLAFHPDFAANGLAFLSFTSGDLVSRLTRVQTADEGAAWDAASIQDILTLDQPYSNHNGGHIAFGPDGMLYWGLGDGGSAGDPQNRAQNLNDLLGKLLRLDVDTAPYAVPADNPFVGQAGRRPEIYAYGLRNPWRFSFDRGTGALWLGDVGQNAVEEVNLIEAGGNYGWRIREGTRCFEPSPCDGDGSLIDPVAEYEHDPGFSVVGGVVYRGSAIPGLVGTYLFSDHYHGRIIGLSHDPDTGAAVQERLLDTGRSVVHFAEDAAGEVVVLDRSAGDMLRLEPAGTEAPAPFPQTLSSTGCFGPGGQPDPGLIPYALNHPFWSDGAGKDRWLAVPDGATVQLQPDGHLSFPPGTVLAKLFEVEGQRVETRLFMHHAQGGWAGYAYRWRADGSDADLVRGGERVPTPGGSWEIPSRAECMQCHTEAAGRSLGPELAQLHRNADYPSTGRLAPQLATLAHIGLLTLPATLPEPLPSLHDPAAPVGERARAYLHVNCAICHQPGGPGRGELDLRWGTPLGATGLCGPPQHGDLGLPDALLITPGIPAYSVLSARIGQPGAYRMPPIASATVDAAGARVVDDWIRGLASCP